MEEKERSCFNCPYKDCTAGYEGACPWLKGAHIKTKKDIFADAEERRAKMRERYRNDPAYRERAKQTSRRNYEKRKAEAKAKNN